MSTNGRIWIDLTHLLQWQGRFTGIERVEFNLASRFASNQNAHFFMYDQAKKAFYELPASTLERFSAGEGGNAVPKKNDISFMRLAKKLLPKSIKRQIKRHVFSGTDVKNAVVAHPFSSRDVIFIGATFSDTQFIKDIVAIRKSTGCKLVHLVHDIIPIVQPAFVDEWSTRHFLEYYTYLLPHADAILAISRSTQTDIDNFCKDQRISCPPITVIREGDDFKRVEEEIRPPELSNGTEFILAVGTFEVRKNYALLYYAYKLAQVEGVEMPNLVIAGRDGWLSDDIRQIIRKDPIVKNKILHLTNIDDKKLAWLFRNCLFTVQPSFYEGWGLPIAESMFYGKLCLTSNTSSMSEVAGNLAEYVSPFDARGCMEKIAFYATHKKALQEKEQRIRSDYKKTSWNDTYEQVRDALEAIIS